MTWLEVPISEVAQVVGGSTPKTGTPEFWGGGIPWATPADLSKLEGHFIRLTPRTLTEAGLRSSGASLLPAGSVLFSSRAPIGHVAVTAAPMATNQGFKSFVPDSSRLDAKFLFWWLRSNKTFLQGLGVGATFKEVSKAIVASIHIPLPPLPEQSRIASILDQADALRAKRRRALALLDDLGKSTFLETVAGESCQDASLVRLSDAYWFQEGPGVRNWQFTDSGVKLLNVGNILKSGGLDLEKTTKYISDAEAYGKYKHFLADEGDFVVASSGISFDEDGLLRTRGAFVAAAHLPLSMNTSTIRFKAREGISTLRFFEGWLNSVDFRRQISRLVTGSAQKNFGPSHLRQLWIPLPSLSVQEKYAEKAKEIARLSIELERHLAKFDELFASLQHRAFSGQL